MATSITTVTAIAAVAAGGGAYVADNRFEQYWAPGQRISRTFALWDSTRGLGRVREEMWPGATVPIGLFRMLGASPALAEHLWHATLLAVAGAGMIALLARFRPVVGTEHLLAALCYQLGPFAATFLIPSNLFFHYALTPWLLVVVHRGMRERDPWPSAAALALLVGLVGNLDTPGLVFAAVPAVALMGFELLIERSTDLRRAAGWAGRALALAVVVSAAALATTAIGAASFSQRLESTETPEVIARTSSWSETLRGLGFWVSYFRDGQGPTRPEGRLLFTSPLMVVATFVPFIVGVVGLALARRSRSHLWFALIAGLGAMLMVGAHLPEDPSPYGAAWLWAAHHIPGVGTLRTTYKAGATMWLGVAALFGLGTVILGERAKRTSGKRAAPAVVSVALVVVVAAPTWAGRLYSPERRLTEVPEYWTEAIRWLDDQPGSNPALILPGATRAVYRWGWPGDDIFDALLARPHLVDAAVTLSTPMVADVLASIDDAAASEDAVLAPVLRRLGVEYLLVRNDLDWRRMGVARPADLAAIRDDPSFERVATFGRVGQNTVGTPDGRSKEERELPPVEVYRVRDASARARTVPPDAPWFLLEGGGDGWLQLARAGLLDGDDPVVPAAAVDDHLLGEALGERGRLVVSDSNRREAEAVTAYSSERSRTLGPDEDLGRLLPDLYHRSGSESVVWYPSARSITDPAEERSLNGFRSQFRAAQAMDGDPGTAWVVKGDGDPRDHSLRVELRSPTTIDRLRVVAADPKDLTRAADPSASFSGVPRIARASLQFSDGSVEHVNLIPGRVDVRFPAHETSSVELHVLDTTRAGDFGIAEMSFPGSDLDLVEHIQLPDDALRRAAASDALGPRMARTPLAILMSRREGAAPAPIEGQLRRRVRVLGDHQLDVAGVLHRARGAGEGACADIGLRIDGVTVPVRIDPSSLREFEGCEPVSLRTGWHDIEATAAVVDELTLVEGGRSAGASVAGEGAEATASSPTSRSVTIPEPGGGLLISGEGFDARWRASVEGTEVGAIPVDAQSAWVIPAGTTRVELWFGPARLYRAAQVVTAVGVAACLHLLTRRRRR